VQRSRQDAQSIEKGGAEGGNIQTPKVSRENIPPQPTGGSEGTS